MKTINYIQMWRNIMDDYRLYKDQLGVDKIGWELGFNECEDDERVGKSGVGVIGKIE